MTYDAVKTCKVGKDAGEQRDNWGVFMYPTHTFFLHQIQTYTIYLPIFFHVMMNYVALYYVINHIILRNKSYGSVCASFGGGCE